MESSIQIPIVQDWIAVVAVAQNGVIGRSGGLPWRLSSDLKRFKRLTMGHCLLMGRKTFESIGKPLPGRQTIVLTQSKMMPQIPGVTFIASLSEVPSVVETNRKVMVVGGAQVYQAALPHCSEIWLTRVLADVDGDVRFPQVDWSNWQQIASESYPASEVDDWPTESQTWQRR